MQNDRQLVTIKGTKEGFVFELDDEHLFSDVYQELLEKLSANDAYHESEQAVSVIIKLGYRFLKDEQKNLLYNIVEENNRFKIVRFDSLVVSKDAALNWLDQNEIKLVNQIVRSGQTIDVTGDLLLVGDVNPGGLVSATGNIFVMGNLQGIAHAGVKGDDEAVIVASYMNPSQLRISKFISRAPDFNSAGVYMECGYLSKEKEQIIIDRLQVLPFVRRQLINIERRMTNE